MIEQAYSIAVYDALYKYPFFGRMLQCLHTSYNRSIPTAGVMFDKQQKKFRLLINPETFLGWTRTERAAVIVHEIKHLVYQHVLIYEQLKDKKRANIAMDLVLNQNIEGLPEGAMQLANFKDRLGNPFPPNKSTFEYYELLEEATYTGKDGKPQPMPGEWDKHEFMDGEASKEEMENALADVFIRAKQSMSSYSDIPGYVQDLLNQFNSNRAKINYKELLNKAFRKSLPQRDRTYTWKRPNKRWGFVAPGTKVDSVPKIEIFADTSGSITYDVLNMMLGIVDGFVSEANSEIKLHLFHTEHYYNKRYGKSTKFNDGDLQSGGTDLNQVIKYIETHPMDLAIILTDGYYGGVSTKTLPTKTLFLIVENGDVNHPLKHLGETFKINNAFHKENK